MKRWFAALAVLFTSTVFAQQVPVIDFESVPNLLKLPKDMHLGEVTGVAVNSTPKQGQVWVSIDGGGSFKQIVSAPNYCRDQCDCLP